MNSERKMLHKSKKNFFVKKIIDNKFLPNQKFPKKKNPK